MSSVSALLALASLLEFVSAGGSNFIGCVSQATVLGKYGANSVGVTSSRSNCASVAQSARNNFVSFWQASTGLCYSAAFNQVQNGDIVAGTDAYGNCASGDFQASDIQGPNFQGCWTYYAPNFNSPYIQGPASGPLDCYHNVCQNPQYGYQQGSPFYAVLWPSTTICRCFNALGGGQDPATGSGFSTGFGTLTTCDPAGANTRFVWYSNAVSPNPSIYRKRAERVRLLTAQKPQELCPAGLSPCAVEGAQDDDSFECLDTASELESCGGCVGRDIAGALSYTGYNCLDLPGVALGGVTCEGGECLVTACDYGYQLQNSTCQLV